MLSSASAGTGFIPVVSSGSDSALPSAPATGIRFQHRRPRTLSLELRVRPVDEFVGISLGELDLVRFDVGVVARKNRESGPRPRTGNHAVTGERLLHLVVGEEIERPIAEEIRFR